MAVTTLNLQLPIKYGNNLPFHGLKLTKFTVESTVMSLGDKITGDVYYIDNSLTNIDVQNIYVMYDGIKYSMVNPPTIVREGLVKDNGDMHGTTKYTFEFYHPMWVLNNFPFTDVAVSSNEVRYKSEDKTFSWMGKIADFVAKLNKNLDGTEWVVVISSSVGEDKLNTLSEVLSFNNNTIGDALKTAYDTWEVPYVIDKLNDNEYYYTNTNNQQVDYYDEGKRFVILLGLPANEIMVTPAGGGESQPFIFRFGQGLGLQNDSRTPRNNKIITRLAGYGSADNIPYGYPQIRWYGDQSWTNTKNNDSDPTAYPIYEGIYGGQYVKLIQHPFTRHHLMPPIYVESLFNKISPYLERELPNGTIVVNPDYDPDTELVDYYDADDAHSYPNVIDLQNPSYEIHEFEKIKPQLIDEELSAVEPYEEQTYISPTDFNDYLDYCIRKARVRSTSTIVHHFEWLKQTWSSGSSDVSDYRSDNEFYYEKVRNDSYFSYVSVSSDVESFEKKILTAANPPSDWDDSMNDNGELNQSYFKLTLPVLDFDLYACAAITQEMTINMRSGACIGCQFQVQVDWDDYKANFWLNDGTFDPNPHTTSGDGHVRDITKYPDSSQTALTLIVAKDTSTFGTVMPNVYQQPAQGDLFNILGISLPITYVTNAETRLEDSMKTFLRENNVYYYDYPLKFDEYFLQKHTNILSQIRNNTIIRFLYNGVANVLYVKELTIKYGESVLPKYNITVTDDVEIVLNKIGQVTEDVSRLRVQVTDLQQYYNGSIYNELNTKLSKTVDDVASGKITFQRGLQCDGNITVGNFANNTSGTRITPSAEVETGSIIVRDSITSPMFVADPLLGYGFAIYNEQDGQSVISKAEFDYLTIRRGMKVAVLEIAEYHSVNGGLVLSPANGTIKSVTTATVIGGTNYICDLKDDSNTFVVGDLVRCQRWDMSITPTDPLKYYWLEVTAVNQSAASRNSITIFVPTGYSGMTPAADDVIVQMGNTTTTNRQGFAIITDGGMSVYDGVNSTSNVALLSKLKAKFGDLSGITWWNGTSNVNLSGYGLYGDSVYLKGSFTLLSNKTVEQTISEGDTTVTTNVTTAFQAADDGIRSSVSKVTNTLQNGGVNLARLTNQGTTGWSQWNSSGVAVSIVAYQTDYVRFIRGAQAMIGAQQMFSLTFPFIKTIANDEKLTLSFDIDYDDSNSATKLTNRFDTRESSSYTTAWTGGGKNISYSNDGWQHFEITASTSRAVTSPDSGQIVFVFNGETTDVKIRNIKLEIGEIGTTYTVAPEDTDDEFTSVRSEISQTAEQISMSVIAETLNNESGDNIYTNDITQANLTLSSSNFFYPLSQFAIPSNLTKEKDYTLIIKATIGTAWGTLRVAPQSYSYKTHTLTVDEKGAERTIQFKFMLSSTASLNYLSVYIGLTNKDANDNDTRAILHSAYLYEGDVTLSKGTLQRTGIDITTGEITLQANLVKFKNSASDTPTMLFDTTDGKILTKYIKADEIDATHLIARDTHDCVIATVNADYDSVQGKWLPTSDGAYRIYYPSTQVSGTWVQNTNKKLEIKDVTYTIDNEDYVTTMRMFEPDGQTIAWELGTDAMVNGFVNPSQAITVVKLVTGINDDDAKTTTTFDGKNYRIKPDPVDTATGEIYDVVSTGYYYDIYYQAEKSPIETTYTRDRYDVTQNQQTGVYEYVKDTISWTESNITINPHNNPS